MDELGGDRDVVDRHLHQPFGGNPGGSGPLAKDGLCPGDGAGEELVPGLRREPLHVGVGGGEHPDQPGAEPGRQRQGEVQPPGHSRRRVEMNEQLANHHVAPPRSRAPDDARPAAPFVL